MSTDPTAEPPVIDGAPVPSGDSTSTGKLELPAVAPVVCRSPLALPSSFAHEIMLASVLLGLLLAQ